MQCYCHAGCVDENKEAAELIFLLAVDKGWSEEDRSEVPTPLAREQAVWQGGVRPANFGWPASQAQWVAGAPFLLRSDSDCFFFGFLEL